MAVRAPSDSDLWWHLQAGRLTVESGRPVQTDTFSHTREGVPWVNHSWLTQAVLFKLFDWFSYAGLALWVGVLVVATFVLIYVQMEGNAFVRAFVAILAATTSAVVWSARPPMVSLLLMAVVGYVLYLLKWRGTNRRWLLPPLFALWVNLHAGYALGFLLIGCFLAGESLNHLLAHVNPGDDPVASWKQLAVAILFVGLFAMAVRAPSDSDLWWHLR